MDHVQSVSYDIEILVDVQYQTKPFLQQNTHSYEMFMWMTNVKHGCVYAISLASRVHGHAAVGLAIDTDIESTLSLSLIPGDCTMLGH